MGVLRTYLVSLSAIAGHNDVGFFSKLREMLERGSSVGCVYNRLSTVTGNFHIEPCRVDRVKKRQVVCDHSRVHQQVKEAL